MPKPSSTTRTANGYQKYFDVRSLKSVASCAAMIFIIIHMIDYLWNFTIPLRILNIITLGICLLIAFLFVVNELGKLEERLILGVANAAFFPLFSVRNWMPPAELERKVDTLSSENRLLRRVNELQRDSLVSVETPARDSADHKDLMDRARSGGN